MEDNKLVCPWLPSTLVSDDGSRVTAFADCYGVRCPYWRIVEVRPDAVGKLQSIWGCCRAKGVLCDE